MALAGHIDKSGPIGGMKLLQGISCPSAAAHLRCLEAGLSYFFHIQYVLYVRSPKETEPTVWLAMWMNGTNVMETMHWEVGGLGSCKDNR